MFEKGVYFDRTKNDANIHYFLNNELASEGVRHFYHKYFTGLNHHYYFKTDSSGKLQKQAEDEYKFKYIMDERNRSIVLRMYGVVKNPGRFSRKSGSSLYSSDYTGNHIVIFENQLKEPPVISLTNPNPDKWIMNHKIDHSLWRVTDIDNYMKGNPFFNQIMDNAEFKKFLERSKVPVEPTFDNSIESTK